MMADMSDGKRRGGRATRRKARENPPIHFNPTLVHGLPAYEILSVDGIERIHEAAMDLVETVGMEFHDQECLDLWRQAGAEVTGQRVRIPRELLMSLIDKVPETYTYNARNPERTIRVGGRNTAIANGYGAPFVYDFDGTRRRTTLEDTTNFFKMAHVAPSIHVSGVIPAEPQDIDIPKRHLHMVYGAIKHSDKPFMGSVTAPENAEDTVAMAKIAFGDDFVDNNTVITALINCNSPLIWDETMLGALKVYARNNQAVLCTPFVLAGASSPSSTVGGVAQLIVEALTGMALGQLIRPGSPMVFGVAIFGVSMKTGAPTFGTPEPGHMNIIVGQLARRYKVPWRSCVMWTGSKAVDAQAGYDSVFSTFPVLLGGCNYLIHGAGIMEAALSMSYAKFALDADVMNSFYRFFSGVKDDDLEEAVATVKEVGPGDHFLGTDHTRNNPFHMPQLQDDGSFEQWQAEGSEDAYTRGLKAARRMLDSYVPPAIDPGVDEALREFVHRREAEL